MRKYLFLFAALAILSINIVYTQDEKHVILTYEQALRMALQDLLSIMDIDAEIEELQEQRDDLREELRLTHGLDTPPRGTAAYETHNEIIELGRQILNLTLQQEQTRLSRESNLRRAIVSAESYEVSLYVAQANLTLVEENLNRAKIRYDFGLISSGDLRAAQNALALAQLDIYELTHNRNTAMQNLNHMLGEPLYQNTRIDFDLEIFELPEEINFSNLITRTPLIRQHQIEVDRKRDARRAYEGNDRDTIAELREAYERVRLERDQAITTMEASIRRGLNELENLQLNRTSLLVELEDAYLAMEAVLINLELRRATHHDLAQAQLDILRVRQRIESNLDSKWVHSFLLANPSVLP